MKLELSRFGRFFSFTAQVFHFLEPYSTVIRCVLMNQVNSFQWGNVLLLIDLDDQYLHKNDSRNRGRKVSLIEHFI